MNNDSDCGVNDYNSGEVTPLINVQTSKEAAIIVVKHAVSMSWQLAKYRSSLRLALCENECIVKSPAVLSNTTSQTTLCCVRLPQPPVLRHTTHWLSNDVIPVVIELCMMMKLRGLAMM